MKNDIKIKLFLVDDDSVFLKSLEVKFQHHTDFAVETFATGELCIKNLLHNPDLIILDYDLDGIDKSVMDGMQTLDKIKKINPKIPVIILSSQPKIEVNIDCLHHMAFDYVVKNEIAFIQLQKIILSIFPHRKKGKEIEQVFGKDEIPFQLSVVSC